MADWGRHQQQQLPQQGDESPIPSSTSSESLAAASPAPTASMVLPETIGEAVVEWEHDAQDPGHTPDEDRSDADPPLSGADLQLSGANAQLSGADLQLSGADLQLSGADLQHSGADLQLSGADLQLSGADPQLSGADPQLSGAEGQQIVPDDEDDVVCTGSTALVDLPVSELQKRLDATSARLKAAKHPGF